MRRVLAGILPLLMVGATIIGLSAPAATAANRAAAACPYGPGQCGGASITVVVQTGNGGVVTLQVTLSGFGPGETVIITINNPNRTLGSFAVNQSGSTNGAVRLPAGIPAGNHTVTALGTQTGQSASTVIHLSQATGAANPCTTAASSTHTSGVVLAAAHLTATCIPQSGLPTGGSPGHPAAATHGVSQLPFTGSNTATYAAIGAILVASGGALVLSSRRRRAKAWR